MLQKDNRDKLLQLFFDSPLTEFQLREISRKVKIAPPSVKNYLGEFEKSRLISIIKNKQGHPLFIANRSEEFKELKKINMINSISSSGILDHITDTCMPDVIILFGSASLGEDVQGSDIDLYIQSKSRELRLEKYEKKLKRKVNLFFNYDFKTLSKELKNNLVNGIVLKGYLEVF